MIRVLHVIDKLSMDGRNPSSCARLFAEWIPLHDQNHYRVAVANLRPRDAAGQFLEDRQIEVHYIDKGKLSPGNVGAIATLIERLQIDLLHLHGYSSANFGRIAASRYGIPCVMHEHAILPVLPHQFIVDFLLRSRTDVAVAVSGAVSRFLVRGRAVPRKKIKVIWNGIDLKRFVRIDPQRVQAFRARFVRPGQRLVGTITRFRKEKGNTHFIKAAQKVLQYDDNVRFVLIGDGPERSRLENLAMLLNIQDRVHFAGFVNDVAVALAALDVAAIPSLQEGFGLALVEAMASARPTVATHVGGMVEMAKHDEHVLFVPPADDAALAEAMIRLLSDEAFAQRLAEAARRHSAQFSIEQNVRELEVLYDGLVWNGVAR